MHHPQTGEACYPLSAAMIAAMEEIAAVDVRAGFIGNLGTARALLGRGFIEPAVRGTKAGEPGVLYRLAERGWTALRISRRSPVASRR